VAPPKAATPEELTVPTGWALTPAGTSCDGYHALDLHVGLDAEQLVVIRDPGGTVFLRISSEPDTWISSFGDWVVYDLEQGGMNIESLGASQVEVLTRLLNEVNELRSSRTVVEVVGWDVGSEGLPQLFYAMSEYMYLTDIDSILATLATAAVKPHTDFDPLWLMLIAPSSSGKEEIQRLLKDVIDTAINDVTLAGLLGRGNKGVLPTLGLGCNGLVTITDFSTLLEGDGKSGGSKESVFSALRNIYDGSYRRDINPTALSWWGRLSIVAACTPSIDKFSAHADALGTRWLYYRMPERDAKTRREVAKMVMHRKELESKRFAAREVATQLITAAQARIFDVGAMNQVHGLPADLDDALIDIALLAAYGRASVPRDWRGNIDGIITAEEPGRLVGQLRMLAIGLAALEVSDEVVKRITTHAALSSMPQDRAKVLEVIARAGLPVSEYRIAKESGMHKNVVARACEDWEAMDFIASQPMPGEGVGPESKGWHLDEKNAEVVRAVWGYQGEMAE
jgi:hypothetical protein